MRSYVRMCIHTPTPHYGLKMSISSIDYILFEGEKNPCNLWRNKELSPVLDTSQVLSLQCLNIILKNLRPK